MLSTRYPVWLPYLDRRQAASVHDVMGLSVETSDKKRSWVLTSAATLVSLAARLGAGIDRCHPTSIVRLAGRFAQRAGGDTPMRRYPSPPGFCCQKRGIWLAAPAIFWVHRTRRIADTLVSERFRPANRLFVIPNPYLDHFVRTPFYPMGASCAPGRKSRIYTQHRRTAHCLEPEANDGGRKWHREARLPCRSLSC